MLKTHIAVSEIPLASGADTLALCGAIIRDAQWIWTAENGSNAPKEIFTRRQICRDCWSADWDGRYVYGCVSAPESSTGAEEERG